MTEESKLAIRAAKTANIIMSLHDLFGITLSQATDIYYRSATAGLIEEGVADLHCRSNNYLASLIWEENQKQ